MREDNTQGARAKYQQALAYADTSTEGGRRRASSINHGIGRSYGADGYANLERAKKVNDPESKAALSQLARQKDLQAADYYGKAAELEPGSLLRAWDYGNQAMALARAGDKAGACVAQNKAAGADPTYKPTFEYCK